MGGMWHDQQPLFVRGDSRVQSRLWFIAKTPTPAYLRNWREVQSPRAQPVAVHCDSSVQEIPVRRKRRRRRRFVVYDFDHGRAERSHTAHVRGYRSHAACHGFGRGSFLYVGNSGSNNISVFSINAAATPPTLTPVAGSPFPIGMSPLNMKVSPSGGFLYVTGTGPPGFIEAFSLNQGVPHRVPGSPFLTGTGPYGLAIAPSGSFSTPQTSWTIRSRNSRSTLTGRSRNSPIPRLASNTRGTACALRSTNPANTCTWRIKAPRIWRRFRSALTARSPC